MKTDNKKDILVRNVDTKTIAKFRKLAVEEGYTQGGFLKALCELYTCN